MGEVSAPAQTLGIDLSADDAKTAACAIRWDSGRATITMLRRKLSNTDLRELIRNADWTGIDAPFSWPAGFRAALVEHSDHGGWPADYRSLDYQLRATDRFVDGIARRPLSVSTDRIGVTAMRCARLLQEIGDERGRRIDLTGDDQVVEIYPAAALSTWGAEAEGFDPGGYKAGAGAKPRRAALVESFAQATRPWLVIPDDVRDAFIESDHVLDAFVAALATRAAALGKTWMPATDEQRHLARVEGWIHVPQPGTLSVLANRS
jgi:predicted nuclease with RNAse H fold